MKRLAVVIALSCSIGAYAADTVIAPGSSWFPNAGPGSSPTAFWDQVSSDGATCNVGYLLNGSDGGACANGFSVINPPGNLQYLANSANRGLPAPSLTFTSTGTDTGTFEAYFTSYSGGGNSDQFGYTDNNGPHILFTAGVDPLGSKAKFKPVGPFQYFLKNLGTATTYLSGANGDHFALFSEAPPAPGGPPTTLTKYWIGAEDVTGGDNDYQDIIVRISSPVPVTVLDTVYQVRYASNLTVGDSVVNITNTGSNGNNYFGPGFGSPEGNICVNVYAFSPDEQLISCCSCLVTPNGLVHVTANNDLVSNTLTGIRPNSIVIKLVATGTGKKTKRVGNMDTEVADYSGSTCTNSAALAGDQFKLAEHGGLLAWGTTLHSSSNNDPPTGPASSFSITETPFVPAYLSKEELKSITNRCTNIIGNGSSFGICRSCRLGGLGGSKM